MCAACGNACRIAKKGPFRAGSPAAVLFPACSMCRPAAAVFVQIPKPCGKPSRRSKKPPLFRRTDRGGKITDGSTAGRKPRFFRVLRRAVRKRQQNAGSTAGGRRRRDASRPAAGSCDGFRRDDSEAPKRGRRGPDSVRKAAGIRKAERMYETVQKKIYTLFCIHFFPAFMRD